MNVQRMFTSHVEGVDVPELEDCPVEQRHQEEEGPVGEVEKYSSLKFTWFVWNKNHISDLYMNCMIIFVCDQSLLWIDLIGPLLQQNRLSQVDGENVIIHDWTATDL